MEDDITMLMLILVSMQEAYICGLLNDMHLAWSMFIDEIEQIREVYHNLDNVPEEANDTSTVLNEHIDHINNAIISP